MHRAPAGAGPDIATTKGFPQEILDAGGLSAAMPGHPNNWAFLAHLTPDLTYLVARGKILGGSTALNGTYFIRARKADFDAWSKAATRNGRTRSACRSTASSRPITTTPPPNCTATTADADLPGLAADPSGDQGVRAGLCRTRIRGRAGQERRERTGLRTAAGERGGRGAGEHRHCYINPARSRPNLTVRGNTTARRILFDGTKATGVEVETHGRSR